MWSRRREHRWTNGRQEFAGVAEVASHDFEQGKEGLVYVNNVGEGTGHSIVRRRVGYSKQE